MMANQTPVSEQTFHIAGILTTVYGLAEIPEGCKYVACLWLLHPRLQTRVYMTPAANDCIRGWNSNPAAKEKSLGLIAIAFDQRNHGSREVNALANGAWRDGNETHAQDMFSIFHGTAMDTSLLMDHLGSYIFLGPKAPVLNQHLVMGVSLGGHSTWQVLFNEPRVSAGIVVIGCPDYMSVMSDRASLSKRVSFTESNGGTFLGSSDFPASLVSSVKRWDPKGQIFGEDEVLASPSNSEQTRLGQLLDATIKRKSILVCSGAIDKLVPYRCSGKFLQFLKNASLGWYNEGFSIQDNVYEGRGHEFSSDMSEDAVKFVSEILTKSLLGGTAEKSLL